MHRIHFVLLAGLTLACGGSSGEKSLAEQGRASYQINCIACHNTDPTQIGPIGPEIAGASRELLEAKVLRNTYPEGYQPKRESKAMVPLPHLEPDIPALTEYLNSF